MRNEYNRNKTKELANRLRYKFVDEKSRFHPFLSNKYIIKCYKNLGGK